jgi:ankyrin repeat protein
MHGQDHLVAWLLKAGAKLSKRDVGGATALMLAAAAGHLTVCRMLLEASEWRGGGGGGGRGMMPVPGGAA